MDAAASKRRHATSGSVGMNGRVSTHPAVEKWEYSMLISRSTGVRLLFRVVRRTRNWRNRLLGEPMGPGAGWPRHELHVGSGNPVGPDRVSMVIRVSLSTACVHRSWPHTAGVTASSALEVYVPFPKSGDMSSTLSIRTIAEVEK